VLCCNFLECREKIGEKKKAPKRPRRFTYRGDRKNKIDNNGGLKLDVKLQSPDERLQLQGVRSGCDESASRRIKPNQETGPAASYETILKNGVGRNCFQN